MSLKHLLAPFSAWERIFSKSFAIPKKDIMREGADRYRGWHTNKVDICIGCGNCSQICQNAAIDMVDFIEAKNGDSGLRPRIDYGRCCWCALCVDICPTDSLRLTNEYVWIELDSDDFVFTPGVDKKSWNDVEKGWRGDKGYDIVAHERVPMRMLDGGTRTQTWAEVVLGYSEEEAKKEAARCMDCGICVAACPANMHIPDYIMQIRDGDYNAAVNTIYETNPMPEMCGKVCTRRCEEACAHAKQGEAVAIRWLKRFATEQFDKLSDVIKHDVKNVGQGKRIGVIGGGPSGITVAYYLAIRGFDVDLYEALPVLGGATFFGIPKYRFPLPSLEKQVEMLVHAGVKIHYSTWVDAELYTKIKEESDAIYVGVGLYGGKGMRVKGEEAPGVQNALDFLRDHHLGKQSIVEPGHEVLVIGGGNTAIDAARVSARLGAKKVTIGYRRRHEDMPADWEEIEDAEHENIIITTKYIPLRIEQTEDGRLDMIWGEAEMIAAKPGRRPRPQLIEGSENHMIVDRIIGAIGQQPVMTWVPEKEAATLLNKWKYIDTNESGMSAVEGVFAGGDLVNDIADAISAIADGLKVVDGIQSYLATREPKAKKNAPKKDVLSLEKTDPEKTVLELDKKE